MNRRTILVILPLLAVLWPAAAAATATGFATGGADTIRTNLWLAEALMAEAVREAAAALPSPPADVMLVPADAEPATELLTTVVTQELIRAGYAPRLESVAGASEASVAEFRYEVLELTLGYPETGRRMGIWKSWVGREMTFVGRFTVVETPGGRILYNDRISRSFQDHVPAEHLAGVESVAYPFTQAEPQESGWKRRFEQIVVLGALAGLVAIYFANTE